MNVARLTRLLREAEERHGEYEPTAPKHHWSDWYAAYIAARAQDRSVEQAVAQAGVHMDTVLDRSDGTAAG